MLSQVDGARWLSLEGIASVNRDADAVRDAELRYAQRYRTPKPNPRRVVVEVLVQRVLVLRRCSTEPARRALRHRPEGPAAQGRVDRIG